MSIDSSESLAVKRIRNFQSHFMNLVKSFNRISKVMKSKATSSEIESNGKYVVQKSILRNEYKYF